MYTQASCGNKKFFFSWRTLSGDTFLFPQIAVFLSLFPSHSFPISLYLTFSLPLSLSLHIFLNPNTYSYFTLYVFLLYVTPLGGFYSLFLYFSTGKERERESTPCSYLSLTHTHSPVSSIFLAICFQNIPPTYLQICLCDTVIHFTEYYVVITGMVEWGGRGVIREDFVSPTYPGVFIRSWCFFLWYFLASEIV